MTLAKIAFNIPLSSLRPSKIKSFIEEIDCYTAGPSKSLVARSFLPFAAFIAYFTTFADYVLSESTDNRTRGPFPSLGLAPL